MKALPLSSKGVGCRSNFDPSRLLYTQDTSFSVKSSLTAVRQGAKVPSSDIFAFQPQSRVGEKITLFLSHLSPQRDCGSERDISTYQIHVCRFNPTLPLQQQQRELLLLPGASACRPGPACRPGLYLCALVLVDEACVKRLRQLERSPCLFWRCQGLKFAARS